jgi:hypothetical protein
VPDDGVRESFTIAELNVGDAKSSAGGLPRLEPPLNPRTERPAWHVNLVNVLFLVATLTYSLYIPPPIRARMNS